LPEEVLKDCADEMLDYKGTGQSVMEMSHRSSAFKPIIEDAEAMVRKLMRVPDNYKIVFLQGGGSTQFAMVPQNLGIRTGKAVYVDTGVWSGKAIKEAKKYVSVDIAASSKDRNFCYIPKIDKITGDYDYAYICLNNTIKGTHWNYIPDTGDIPLVADISSCILSEPLDVSAFGLVFAGAQKNLGPAGVTLVIIRDDLITDSPQKVFVGPGMFWCGLADKESLSKVLFTVIYRDPETKYVFVKRCRVEGYIMNRDYFFAPDGKEVLHVDTRKNFTFTLHYVKKARLKKLDESFKASAFPEKGLKAQGTRAAPKEVESVDVEPPKEA